MAAMRNFSSIPRVHSGLAESNFIAVPNEASRAAIAARTAR